MGNCGKILEQSEEVQMNNRLQELHDLKQDPFWDEETVLSDSFVYQVEGDNEEALDEFEAQLNEFAHKLAVKLGLEIK